MEEAEKITLSRVQKTGKLSPFRLKKRNEYKADLFSALT
jgi:hypothetical protein